MRFLIALHYIALTRRSHKDRGTSVERSAAHAEDLADVNEPVRRATPPRVDVVGRPRREPQTNAPASQEN